MIYSQRVWHSICFYILYCIICRQMECRGYVGNNPLHIVNIYSLCIMAALPGNICELTNLHLSADKFGLSGTFAWQANFVSWQMKICQLTNLHLSADRWGLSGICLTSQICQLTNGDLSADKSAFVSTKFGLSGIFAWHTPNLSADKWRFVRQCCHNAWWDIFTICSGYSLNSRSIPFVFPHSGDTWVPREGQATSGTIHVGAPSLVFQVLFRVQILVGLVRGTSKP